MSEETAPDYTDLIVPVRDLSRSGRSQRGGPRARPCGPEHTPPTSPPRPSQALLFSSSTSSDNSMQSRESNCKLILEGRKIPYLLQYVDVDADTMALYETIKESQEERELTLPAVCAGEIVLVRAACAIRCGVAEADGRARGSSLSAATDAPGAG